MIVFARQSRLLPADWSFVWEIFFFSGTYLEIHFAENDARFKLRERCESTRWSTPAARGWPTSANCPPQRRDVPKTISSSRGNSPTLAWYRFEARASPDSHVLPACLPADSFFLLSYFRPSRPGPMNRFQADTRLYVTGHVWGPIVFQNRAVLFFYFFFFARKGCLCANLIHRLAPLFV